MGNKTFIKIPAGEMPTVLTVTPEDNELRILQDAVDGYIEAVGLPDGHCLYVNEEGKLHGLPINLIATDITRGVLPFWDCVLGDAVLVGPTDDEGDSTSVSAGWLRTFDSTKEALRD